MWPLWNMDAIAVQGPVTGGFISRIVQNTFFYRCTNFGIFTDKNNKKEWWPFWKMATIPIQGITSAGSISKIVLNTFFYKCTNFGTFIRKINKGD